MKQILSTWDDPRVGLVLLCLTLVAFLGYLVGWWSYIFLASGIILMLWWSAYVAPLGYPGQRTSDYIYHTCNCHNTRRFGL